MVTIKLLFLGIGNEFFGDDYAGILLLEKLQETLKNNKKYKEAKFINAGSSPENFIEQIINYSPEIILILDAVNMNIPYGHFKIITKINETILDTFPFTHNISLNMFIKYLKEQFKVKEKTIPKIILIGIQPRSLEFGTSISPEIKNAIDKYYDKIIKVVEEKILRTHIFLITLFIII